MGAVVQRVTVWRDLRSRVEWLVIDEESGVIGWAPAGVMAKVIESDALADAIARAMDAREQERAGIRGDDVHSVRVFPVRRDVARERRRRAWRPRSASCGRVVVVR